MKLDYRYFIFVPLGASALILVGFILFNGNRYFEYARHSRVASAVVTQIEAQNGECGTSKKNFPCTKFKAALEIRDAIDGVLLRKLDAGTAPNIDQPVTLSSYKAGQTLEVRYFSTDGRDAVEADLSPLRRTVIVLCIALVVELLVIFGIAKYFARTGSGQVKAR